MSDNLKPCRHDVEQNGRFCNHPIIGHLLDEPRTIRIVRGRGGWAKCHDCPCHEPQPDPTPSGHSGDTNKMVHDKP